MPEFKLFKPKEAPKTSAGQNDNSNKKDKTIKIKKVEKGNMLGKSRGKVPTKTSINLIIKEKESVSLKRLLPGIAIAILLTLILGKIFVFDKVTAMMRATHEVTEMQSQLDAAYSKIASYGDIEDEYAHYTYSGMTEEELGRVDRVSVMALVREILAGGVKATGWSLKGNDLTITVNGASLQRLNELSRRIEKKDIVDRCVITTANKTEKIDLNETVNASFIIYLKKPDNENETNESEENSQGTGTQTQPTGKVKEFNGKEAAS